MHVEIKYSLAHLQDLIPNLTGLKYTQAKIGIKSCRCARECFMYTCIWLYALQLTVGNAG